MDEHIRIVNMFATYYNRNINTYTLCQLEEDYQNEIRKFSEAYLLGATWYKGDSYIQYFYNKKFNTKCFGPIAAYALYYLFYPNTSCKNLITTI